MKWWKRKRLDRDRSIRLRQKAQKFGVLDRLPEIVQECHSWNRRRGKVQAVRFEEVQGG